MFDESISTAKYEDTVLRKLSALEARQESTLPLCCQRIHEQDLGRSLCEQARRLVLRLAKHLEQA